MNTPTAFENIDAGSRDTQLRVGVTMIALGLAIAAALVRFNAGSGPRAFLFFPFLIGFYCVVSSLLGTCAMAALMARRWTCGGHQRMGDPRAIAGARRRGLLVLSMSVSGSALATIAMMVAH